jgi:hypothetical protein
LLVLPIASCLGPLVAKDGSDIIEPHWLGQVMHAMLDIGAAHRSRALRAQGHHRSAPVWEGVHLLGHDVCLLTDAADKKAGVFKNGGLNALVAMELADSVSLLLDISPVSLFSRQDI